MIALEKTWSSRPCERRFRRRRGGVEEEKKQRRPAKSGGFEFGLGEEEDDGEYSAIWVPLAGLSSSKEKPLLSDNRRAPESSQFPTTKHRSPESPPPANCRP